MPNEYDLEAEYSIETEYGFDCIFEVNAVLTEWGNIQGEISSQTDLMNLLETKADVETVNGIDERLETVENTIDGYGNIVTHDVSDFATAEQGALADTSLQPNDNISELYNDAGYITSSSLPTVNNSTITIQKNGTKVEDFTLNQSTDKSINITVPTQLSDLGTETQMSAINSGMNSTLAGQITTNQNAISLINGKIPEQASSNNQLADKNFVNSSISTNTANFIGTFNSVADLEAYSGTLTNNDYAFVIGTDGDGNTVYNRYKYTTATTPASWIFEYELNNSSFTASQWASINSGANTTNIGQIATNTNDISDINTTIGGYGDIVTHDVSEFATASQGALADTSLQNGTDVINALGYTPYNSTNPNNYSSTLNGLTDVELTNPTQGQNVTYDAVNQKWINSSTSATVGWGGITGTLSDQSDLQNALNDKQNVINANNKLSASYISGLGAVATSNNYNDLSNKPTIPTVNNATLTIQKNGTNVQTFTANASTNATANITVPTDVSDLTNTTLANVSLSNLNTDGNNKLHALKGYTESGQVYSDSQLYNDILAQYSTATITGTDLIITDNYTVVGSPTITDGVASGFSYQNGDYVTSGSFLQNLGDYDTWSIEIPITFRAVMGNNFDAFLSSRSADLDNTKVAIMLQKNNSQRLRYYLKAQDGTNISYGSTSSDTFSGGESLIFKLEFTGTQYIVSTKKTGENWVVQSTFNNTKKLMKINRPLIIGVEEGVTSNPWGGSINLYGIRIFGNGHLIYAGKCQIPYNISDSGNKIADVQYRPDVYFANYLGYKSSYFTIDTVNQNVTLPYTDLYGLINQSLNYNYKLIQGYDATATQTLKHVNGVLQWVTD